VDRVHGISDRNTPKSGPHSRHLQGGTPESAPQVKTIPEFIVHGDADTTAPVARSRAMVAELKRLGVEHQYVEVPGGSHGGVVAPNLAGMFDFFDRHKK